MGICSGTSTEWLFVHCSRSNWNLAVLIFAEGGKPENPEKNPRSEDENQQQICAVRVPSNASKNNISFLFCKLSFDLVSKQKDSSLSIRKSDNNNTRGL